MEAANREERRLMRQRGAGTRKIQEVDFGFSFGPPVAQPAPPPRRTPQPEQSSSASRKPLPRDPTPEAQQPFPPPQSDRRNSQTRLHTPTTRRSPVRRSPASSRNGHTSSVYDIPPDSPREPSSSAKRRRIGASPKDRSTPTIRENGPLEINGVGPHEVENTESFQEVQIDEAQKTTSPLVATESPGRAKTQTPQLNEPISSLSSTSKDGLDLKQREQTPINNYQNGTLDIDTQPDLAESSSKPQATKPRKKARKRKSVSWPKKRRRSSDEINKQRNEEAQEQAPEPEPESEQESEPELPEQPQHSPARKWRKPKSIDEHQGEQEAEPAAVTEETEETGISEEATGLKETAARIPEKKGPKSTKRQSVLPRKKKTKTPRAPSIEQQPEDEIEIEEEPEDVEENVDRSTPDEPEPEPSRKARNKRKSTRQGPTNTRHSLETVQEEPEAQAEDEDGRAESPQQTAPRKKPRKTRQPNSETESRKGTFPVTVHRLANVSALDAVYESDKSSNEAGSSDELSAKQKFPNRGGVNPADVLSQICRETLDKTLSALENGIASETQAARRAEFTRKRKAVEAFSDELEGRLFDMSEILDSNFSLAMGLRGAKKEMMESRGKLMDIRRQREEVALRMDEVRRKHLEEETMQTQHNAVNNSLHKLELAIDRDQSHPEPINKSNPAAGLEFLLRSVADDVSSAAPGSQGGLLNQIKNFNARLEERVKRR